ncbi:hypothetical protein [Dyadobacter aurulentus]|uniref:hypothetical protein n=1 Tax=Dyadobacter sp. UC 10 TaxID=2605428 RepID=UPI0011F13823|nr:hypothetical protein [Dyadobacter sp. UC 10]KAA0992436.1 hypothetical protein FXO21_20760 [Dyadobacter sp. UC 10]
MKAVILLTICCLMLACTHEEPRSEWKTFDFDIFTLQAPSKWKEFSAQGYDSVVGGVTDGKDTLYYDYGMYSYRFTSETSQTHIITETNRDGYPTKMVKPKKPGQGVIGIYYNLGNSLRLTLYGRSRDENIFVQMIESIKIK